VLESWTSQPLSLRLLRAFLGVTFVYAGIQKLTDGYFLHAGSPDYIGAQLLAFAHGTPLGGLMRVLAHMPTVTGIGIAVTEIAVGLGTLAGVAPMTCAAVGFLVNLTLTLSATWHVHPYFLGSDSMYAIGWLAYLAGLYEVRERSRRATAEKRLGKKVAPIHADAGMTRREFVRGGALAGATILTAGAAAALAGSASATPRAARSGGSHGASGAGSGGGAATGTQAGAAQSNAIADLSQIPVGGAIGFNAPGVGPSALVRVGKNDVVAYSRTCTHAGCLVGYDTSARLLVCPCHGAEFDPARNATPVAGPAPTPLAPVSVAVDPSTGKVVLTG
jgi:thiosulfate dehydrogenase [quinone] large subunit